MYIGKNGRRLNEDNMISRSRQEQMLDNGYACMVVRFRETAQEAYDRLSKTHNTVRIYSDTTCVRGYHDLYAMVKD